MNKKSSGYRLNRLDEPIFMAGPKPMRTEFGIRQRLESCEGFLFYNHKKDGDGVLSPDGVLVSLQ